MTYDGFDLSGRIALITGGTSGLGRAIALGFARSGARVIVGSRTEAKVDDTLNALSEIGTGHKGIIMDVGDPASIEATFREFDNELNGRLDILVNAAGIIQRKPTLEVTAEEFERVVHVNLTGTFLCCQAAARRMIEIGGGSIINIASISSFRGLSEVSAYGASKAAVVQLTKSLAVDWARHNIRVNALAPGVFPTDLNRKFLTGTTRGAQFIEITPMRRFGDPEELVGAAIYLASRAASYTTGETLVVDGGLLAKGVGPDDLSSLGSA